MSMLRRGPTALFACPLGGEKFTRGDNGLSGYLRERLDNLVRDHNLERQQLKT